MVRNSSQTQNHLHRGVVGIRGIVRRLTADNKFMPIILQADRSAPAGIVIRVIDECKLANPASVVSISTESP